MEKLPLRQAISSAQFLCEMPHFMRIGRGKWAIACFELKPPNRNARIGLEKFGLMTQPASSE